MCIIIIKDNPSKEVKEDTLIRSSIINPHGLGIVWLDTYEITYHKSKEWRKLKTNRPYIAHFRYATVGKVCRANVHPFVCGDNQDEYLMQNGTIRGHGYGSKNVTDTQDLADHLCMIKRAHWSKHLAKFDCRFVTINTKHKSYQIYNKNDWHKQDGVWYSKTNVFPYYVAVYGTLKQGYSNHRLLEHTSFLGSGVTEKKYPLVVNGLPYVYDEGGVGHNVTVELYECDHEDMKSLDMLEGHPNYYCRKEIPIVLDDGERVIAWLYFINSKWNGSVDDCIESYSKQIVSGKGWSNYSGWYGNGYDYRDFYLGGTNTDTDTKEHNPKDYGLNEDCSLDQELSDNINDIEDLIEDVNSRISNLSDELKRLASSNRGSRLKWADDNICPECGTKCIVDELEGLAYCSPCDAMYHSDTDFQIL